MSLKLRIIVGVLRAILRASRALTNEAQYIRNTRSMVRHFRNDERSLALLCVVEPLAKQIAAQETREAQGDWYPKMMAGVQR